MDNLVKVQCILKTGYNDKELKEYIEEGRIYYVNRDRAKYLENKNAVKILKDENEEIEKLKRRTRHTI